MNSKTDTRLAHSDGFETSTGTLYVSKPYHSKSSKKLRAQITFAPRNSAFDINNEHSVSNEFRGFFSLFWISIFIFSVQTYVRSIEANGRPLNLHFATMFSQDAITLALSDAVLVLSTGICVPFAMAIKNGWIRYYWTGLVLQHLLQTSLLFGAITWTFNRDWPWVQSGFLTLHSLVMIMKMHSYVTLNWQLQSVTEQSQELFVNLTEKTKAVGGWDKALADAIANLKQADLQFQASIACASPDNASSTREPTPIGTPPVPVGSSTSYVDASTASALRQRLRTVASLPNGENLSLLRAGVDVVHPHISHDRSQTETPVNDRSTGGPSPHPLIHHPNHEISAMAKDYSELRSELTSGGPHRVTWPNNISWKNFAVYQLIPTLVYDLEYPRTDRIRPVYVFEKTVATFGTFALLYTVTESFILPYTPTADQSFLRSLLDLALPFMVAYLLLFYIIFECICNGFAELSYFADRQFYEDWYEYLFPYFLAPALSGYRWNSTSWDEFARKWNKPVHVFLLRHVYTATIMSYRVSRTTAMLLTFLLSACVHELVMSVVTRKFRMYLFILQIVQIPMIMLSRIPAIKRNKLMGNVVFWLGLYAGFPLLCVAYVAY